MKNLQVKSHCLEQGIEGIPFLLYTGLRQFGEKKLEESGVDRVISKPIPYEELRSILHKAVERRIHGNVSS